VTRAERIARRFRRRQLRHWQRHDHKRWNSWRTLELLYGPTQLTEGVGYLLSVRFVEPA